MAAPEPGVFALAVLLLTAGCVSTPSPAGGPASAFPQALSGLGTEPFWNVELNGTTLRFKTPETPNGWTAKIGRRAESDRLQLFGTLAGAPFRATIQRQSCSDGMSDRSYPYTLEMQVLGRALHGCAFLECEEEPR